MSSDIAALQPGIRSEIWHGWGWSGEQRMKFGGRKSIILNAVRNQLIGFRIFVADVGTQPRMLERLAASIMNNLYQQPSPFSDIPDRGTMLAPRWNSENSIIGENKGGVILHGFSPRLEI